ncbi:hypothetical protein AAMO2058_000338400 [Amorphochlora amoebiformis]|uniref:CTLH domain-containing protein n=1 Tax=Amorphochlora amoebiformis TaxID=1561963 RepID=A0A7S0DLH0_9EUKA|mmetsp:Transcript_33163/g.53258  ORF Transcript_33163/g.53258 Transcript_33163/m.53258 type:complete len:254 (+) Transcript_33163:116-877(+)
MSSSSSKIGMEEWTWLLDKQEISGRLLDEIVMNYFIVNGYKDVAMAFMKDSGLKPSVPLESVQDRMDIRKAVFEGNILKVIEKVNDLNPEILDSRPQLYFMLQQQRLIELIRQGPDKLAECLGFARRELAPRAATNEKFLEEMEKVMALLAFPEPAKSAVGYLLSFEQRQKVVDALNTAILTSQCQSKDPRLLFLLKKMVFLQGQLKDQMKVDFPSISDLKSAKLDFSSPAEDKKSGRSSSSSESRDEKVASS